MAKVFSDNEYFDFEENTSDEIKHNKLFAYIKKEVDNLELSDKQRVADLQFFITRTIKHTPMLIESLCKCLITLWDESKSVILLEYLFKYHIDDVEESAVLHQLESIQEGLETINISLMTRAIKNKRMSIIDLLLDYPVDIHSPGENCDFLTVLSMYAKPSTLKKALKHGDIDVNGSATNTNNLNPINASIRHGKFDVTALLLKNDSFDFHHSHHTLPKTLNKDTWSNFPINPLLIYLKPHFDFLYTKSQCQAVTILEQMLDNASDNKSTELSLLNQRIILEEDVKGIQAGNYTLLMLAMLRQPHLKHQIPMVDIFCQYPGVDLNVRNPVYGSCWDIASTYDDDGQMLKTLQDYAIIEAKRSLEKISQLLMTQFFPNSLADDSPINIQAKKHRKIFAKISQYCAEDKGKNPPKLLRKIQSTIDKATELSNNNNEDSNANAILRKCCSLIIDCSRRIDPKYSALSKDDKKQVVAAGRVTLTC